MKNSHILIAIGIGVALVACVIAQGMYPDKAKLALMEAEAIGHTEIHQERQEHIEQITTRPYYVAGGGIVIGLFFVGMGIVTRSIEQNREQDQS